MKRTRVQEKLANPRCFDRLVNFLPNRQGYDKATMDLLALLQAEVLPSDAVSIVKQLLEARPDCNAFTKDGKSLLELSIRHRREDIATSLLEHGAYSNFVSLVEHWSMMMLAVSLGEVNIVKKLLEYHACLSHLDRIGRSAFDMVMVQPNLNTKLQLLYLLCHFARDRNLQIFQMFNLFQAGQLTINGFIFEAINNIASEELVSRLEELFDLGADVNSFKDGASPLLHCIYKGRIGGAKACLEHGADVDIAYPSTGNTAIMAAIIRNQYAVVVEILKYRPNLLLVNKKGHNVFKLAAFTNTAISQLLEPFKPADVVFV